ncbi:unnamed protein product [Agarophyton chilense]|eukprot:gb/GEZJ01002388.1/.p1 GENE.gb/GEZJ01002388.1/~~gb/GEZJ01002388.1/.p1  ORF type:complete len:1135 (-),score=251.76 gb/GEZJ01002388.1/:1047-4382(-)
MPPSSPPPPGSPPRPLLPHQSHALHRFGAEAASVLSRAHPDAHDRLVESDRLRLQRFHQHAVSFLERAFADQSTEHVEDTALSPKSPRNDHHVQMLHDFHHEALSIADVAVQESAFGAPDAPDVLDSQNASDASASAPRRDSTADSTLVRITRDKQRLEQHYRDAVSFLNRTDNGGGLVEEQELDAPAVDRLQLQRYAREAMIFLDKAFRDDVTAAAVAATGDASTPTAQNGPKHLTDEEENEEQEQDVETALGDVQEHDEEQRRQRDEERQIAEDRAALQRYEYEYDQFLSKAYQDDSAMFVEDADSVTTTNSASDRGLYARRMAPSTPSAESASYSGSATQEDEDFSDEEAHTDDEFQDPSTAESAQLPARNFSLYSNAEQVYPAGGVGHSDCDLADDGNGGVHEQMVRYEQEAADYFNGTNVSDEEDARFDAQVAALEARENDECRSPEMAQRLVADEGVNDRVDDTVIGNDEEDIFGVDRQVDEEQRISLQELKQGPDDNQSSSSEFEIPSTKFPDRVEAPQHSPEKEHGASPVAHPLVSSNSKDLLVDVILENKAGKSQKWSQVSVDRSFYRQVPRGSTVKFRPRISPQLSQTSQTGSGSNSYAAMIPLGELQRVEKERDTALATLEDIVNERSMLAAQVSEMKSMITSTGSEEKHREFWEDDDKFMPASDIDLASELREAHATMEKLTEEMETTLSVLDARYRETLSRAHKAEEKCIRLESNASMLENEFASQGVRLSKAIAEQQRLGHLMKRKELELETLRRKAEKDLQKIDEAYSEEAKTRMQRIRELTSEITTLQEKLKAASGRNERRLGSSSASRRLELEVSALKRRLGDSERKVNEERLSGRRKMETELKRMQNEHDEEVRSLVGKLDGLERQVAQVEDVKREMGNLRGERERLQATVTTLETKVVDVTKNLKEAKREQIAAEAEAKHVRSRYEESLKKKLVEMDHGGELAELQHALQGLRDEATMREKKLKQQLDEFRARAEQAEVSAARAEKDAKEAAEVAKLAQERSRQAVETERKMRQTAEAEKEAIVVESKAWEKLAQQQMEQSVAEVEIVKSSSRRGLRRSHSKGRDGSKKKDKGGRSDESGRKKNAHRPRLFG